MDIAPWDMGGRYSSYASGERQGPASSRSEQLFYAEEYRIFFLTGQDQESTGRKTGISVRPARDFAPEALESMKAQALAWTRERNHEVVISVRDSSLVLRDSATAAESIFPIEKLDADIAEKYSSSRVSAAWEKYAPASCGNKDSSGDTEKLAAARKQNVLKL